jgi:hypothetical protein
VELGLGMRVMIADGVVGLASWVQDIFGVERHCISVSNLNHAYSPSGLLLNPRILFYVLAPSYPFSYTVCSSADHIS